MQQILLHGKIKSATKHAIERLYKRYGLNMVLIDKLKYGVLEDFILVRVYSRNGEYRALYEILDDTFIVVNEFNILVTIFSAYKSR